ncbi:MAG: hypothetical protein ACI9ON_001865 [Limisphaerales bacterium]|jgi:hypothetical protein
MFSPSSERNKDPILDVFRSRMPHQGHLLEIAAGSLQHALYMAPCFPELDWHTSDISAPAIENGQVLLNQGALPKNVFPPTYLDVLSKPWPLTDLQAIYSANLFHISPYEVVPAFFAGARQSVTSPGDVFIYGPYKEGGKHTAAGNEEFDADLRSRNPTWGIRDLEQVVSEAIEQKFVLSERIQMPANNLFLHFKTVLA